MKKSVFIFVILTVTFAITGCPEGGGGGPPPPPTRKFWAQNADNEKFYQLDAELLAENTRCRVWVEKGSGVTAATANSVANEYANNIYNKMLNNFGWDVKVNNMNTMEYAHYFATGETNNAKLTILLLDIKDGYKSGENESYVAGYFWPYDFLLPTNTPQGYKSNVLDMIYIDTNPGLSDGKINEVYMTLAHEMQHFMNFTSSIAYRVTNNTIYAMETWIDEGLSSAAEWVYSGKHIADKVDWFSNNGNGDNLIGDINKGNNFYVWGNREQGNQYAILDDYATVYLFFQWLRLQSHDSIYKEIIKSPSTDKQAVINAFNAKNISGATYSSWEGMLKDWLKANVINSDTGREGYKGDSTLKGIKISYAPQGTTTLGLYSGEGVYSYSASNPSYSPSGNIKYEYLNTEKTLLTYNSNTVNSVDKNTNINTLIEVGTTTGNIKPSVIIIKSGNFDTKLGPSKISGPFPIGMGDVIRMNNNGNRFSFDSFPLERVFINE